MEKIIEHIVHDLPYVIRERLKDFDKTTDDILKHITAVFKGNNEEAKRELTGEIETAYLNKETLRMYDRLEKTGRDMALVSHKLTSLKKRGRKG